MSLKSKLVTGVFWSAVEKYSSTAVALIVSAVLARLVSPEEFGIVSLASVMIAFFSICTSMGIVPAIIQRNDLTSKNLDSIFTYTIILGAIVALLFFSCSWCISSFYNNVQLIYVCQLLSLNLFLSSINLVPNALMLKNQRFKLIAIRTLVIQIVGCSLAIWAAYTGWGVYALLISPLLSLLLMLVFNLYNYPRAIDWTFDKEPLKRIFSYSAYQFLFEMVNYFSRNLDKLIIGRSLNMSALGYYDKSYRLMLMPLQQITSVISPVLQPVLSSLQEQKREMGEKYNKLIAFIGHISFPLAVFLYFSAFELINIVFGNNWNPSVPAFKILALSLPLQMILSTSGSIFQASNTTNLMFFVGIRNTISTVSCLIIAVSFFSSIEAVAWSWVISLTINFIMSYHTMYHKVFESNLKSMVFHLRMPLLSAIIMISLLLLQESLLPVDNIYLSFAVKCLVAMISMAILLFALMRFKVIDIIKFLRS
ncbi:lipopolysaccharide biosynthesis protein [uncultured Bacteroides sp.]|jgi:O-antigen/teichoic acid export membrane protein|uniref:lipopolysaccharide biosynthesis protein n=1 Tax=uncultured Bacteroides sp. TaxID=162156 RepID=UPI002585D4AA|nr:lipopolysaccharide biosynthesis protein [uncultured Bacteroides sp.]